MNLKSISINQTKILTNLALFALFLVVATFAPLLKQQFITGPIVNALLFISTIYLGRTGGILIGCLPSLFAGFIGLLPGPLMPLIPYIIASNAVLVLSFSVLRKKSFWLAAITSSFFKFLFLFSVSSFFINFFIQGTLPAKIALMMSWPQLITALSGSLIAFLVLKISKKNLKN